MSTLSIEQVGLWNKDFLNLEWTATTESYLIVLVTYEGLPGAANSSSVFAIKRLHWRRRHRHPGLRRTAE